MQKILIAPMTLASQEGEYQRSLREAGFELVYPSRATQLIEEELLRAIQGVKGTLAGSEPYTRRVIESNVIALRDESGQVLGCASIGHHVGGGQPLHPIYLYLGDSLL